MAKTVQPDRKLMVEALMIPKVSRAGLMMIPPPMPQMAPTVQAQKQMRKMRRWIMVGFLSGKVSSFMLYKK